MRNSHHMVTINTNYPSLVARDKQRQATSDVAKAIERLSSGMRINNAADDAAGAAIANRMEANLRANQATTRNVADGISLAQTAEGGLDSINELVQRARQLAIQAANGSLSTQDRASIHGEFESMRDEIDRIARSTEIFGRYPLAPDANQEQPAKLGNTLPLKEKFPASGGSASFSSGIVSMAYVPKGATNLVLRIDSLGMDDDIQLFTRDGKHLVGTPILGDDPDHTWVSRGVTDAASAGQRVLTEENGFLPGATYSADTLLDATSTFDPSQPFTPLDPGTGVTSTYNGADGDMTFTYSGDGDRYEDGSNGGNFNDGSNGYDSTGNLRYERLHIDVVTEDLIVIVAGNGAFQGWASWDAMPEPTQAVTPRPPHSEATDIVVKAHYGQEPESIRIDATPADAVSLGIQDAALDPADAATEAISLFDRALRRIDTYRGQYGSVTNRFESVTQTLQQDTLATSAARSRIIDADYALETSNLTRAQILSQAGTAVLAQANSLPEVVLELLG